MRERAAIVLLLAATLAACGGDDDGPSDADGGVRDATIVDAPFDAAVADGGAADSAVAIDAGPPRMCATEMCDPRDAMSCGMGACVLAGGEPTCVTMTGSADEGVACETVLDCAPGLACFASTSGGAMGVCGRPCCPWADGTCEAGETCGGTGALVDGTNSDWGRCLPARMCEVVAMDSGCEPDEGCYIVSATGETQCLRAGMREAGEPCTAQNDCAEGFFCAVTRGVCVRICTIGMASSCPAGEGECRAYSHTPMGTGLCTLETMR